MMHCLCWFMKWNVIYKGRESRLVSLDCNAAFDTANHKGVILKSQSVDVGGEF